MTDRLPLGMNEPAPASKVDLIEVLVDALARVRADDSSEGFIQWSMAGPDPCHVCGGSGRVRVGGHLYASPGEAYAPCNVCKATGSVWRDPAMKEADFELMARYRVGNSTGQGGVSIFQKDRAA